MLQPKFVQFYSTLAEAKAESNNGDLKVIEVHSGEDANKFAVVPTAFNVNRSYYHDSFGEKAFFTLID